jgi:mono/diheme cytochrome c family protein
MKNNQFIFDLFLIVLLCSIGVPFSILMGYSHGKKMISEISGDLTQEPILLTSPDSKSSLASAASSRAPEYKDLLFSEASVEKGKSLYAVQCALCHGENGDGKGAAGKDLKPPPRDFIDPKIQWTKSRQLKDIFISISEGSPGTGMVGYKSTISFQDRWALVHYLSTLPGIQGQFQTLDQENAVSLFQEIAE